MCRKLRFSQKIIRSQPIPIEKMSRSKRVNVPCMYSPGFECVKKVLLLLCTHTFQCEYAYDNPLNECFVSRSDDFDEEVIEPPALGNKSCVTRFIKKMLAIVSDVLLAVHNTDPSCSVQY